jgi:hypothetical protein
MTEEFLRFSMSVATTFHAQAEFDFAAFGRAPGLRPCAPR